MGTWQIVKPWERIEIHSFQTEIGVITEKNENTSDGDLLKVIFVLIDVWKLLGKGFPGKPTSFF